MTRPSLDSDVMTLTGDIYCYFDIEGMGGGEEAR